MGRPEVERGGPGGGGMGRPEGLTGGRPDWPFLSVEGASRPGAAGGAPAPRLAAAGEGGAALPGAPGAPGAAGPPGAPGAAGAAGRFTGRGPGGGGTVTSLAGRLVTRPLRRAGGGAEAAAGWGAGVEGAGVEAAAGCDAGARDGPAGAGAAGAAGRTGVASAAGRAGLGRGSAAGSSGTTGRRRPSASALRRTRSAWASSIEDEWLFTPIPNDKARSSASLLVRPSSLASS
jgi:hypothetical protein